MDSLLDFITKNGAAIQVISSFLSVLFSFVLVVVTIIYVKATFKMVHSTQKAYLRPINLSENKKEVVLKNLGSAIAIKVQLYAEPSEIETLSKDYSEIYIEDYVDIVYDILKDKFIKASCESFDIQQNESCKFTFPVRIDSNNSRFLIFWESITGERNYKVLNISTDSNGQLRILDYKGYKKANKLRNMFLFCALIIAKFFIRISLQQYPSLYEEIAKKMGENKKK